MPKIDGLTFPAAQRTDAEPVHIPVIVMFADYDLQAGSARIAAADVLAKPFDADHLLAEVETQDR